MIDKRRLDKQPPLALVTDFVRGIEAAITEHIIMVDDVKGLAQHHTHLCIRDV